MKIICFTFMVVACLMANIHCLPVESVTSQPEEQQTPPQIAVPVPALIGGDFSAEHPQDSQSVVAVIPLSLLDIETANQSAAEETSQRSARGLGGFGGLGKFGLGFKGFGGFNSWGLGGLHGLGGGLHGFGFKPFFKHFG